MRRGVVAGVALVVAIIVQLTLVNRLNLPGGGRPDIVLVLVAALAMTTGPVPGMIAGFLTGLGLDFAPPGGAVLGLYALTFCLVGYAAGRLRRLVTSSAVVAMAATAVIAAGGEALVAVLGKILDPAQVSVALITLVLPYSAAYDVVLSPFALYLVIIVAARLGPVDLAAAAPSDARHHRGGELGVVPGYRTGLGAAAGGAVLPGLGGWLAGPPKGWRARRRVAHRDRRFAAGLAHGTTWYARPAGPKPRRHSPRLRAGTGVAGSAVRRPLPSQPSRPVRLRLSGSGGLSTAAARRGYRRGPAGGGYQTRGFRARGGPGGTAFAQGQGRPNGALRPGGGRTFRPRPASGGTAFALVQGSRPARGPGPGRAPRLGTRHRGDGLVGGGVLATRHGYQPRSARGIRFGGTAPRRPRRGARRAAARPTFRYRPTPLAAPPPGMVPDMRAIRGRRPAPRLRLRAGGQRHRLLASVTVAVGRLLRPARPAAPRFRAGPLPRNHVVPGKQPKFRASPPPKRPAPRKEPRFRSRPLPRRPAARTNGPRFRAGRLARRYPSAARLSRWSRRWQAPVSFSRKSR